MHSNVPQDMTVHSFPSLRGINCYICYFRFLLASSFTLYLVVSHPLREGISTQEDSYRLVGNNWWTVEHSRQLSTSAEAYILVGLQLPKVVKVCWQVSRLWAVINLTFGVPLTSVNNFLPQIVGSLGYSTVKTNLFTVAPNIVGALTLVILTFSSDYFRERSIHMWVNWIYEHHQLIDGQMYPTFNWPYWLSHSRYHWRCAPQGRSLFRLLPFNNGGRSFLFPPGKRNLKNRKAFAPSVLVATW